MCRCALARRQRLEGPSCPRACTAAPLSLHANALQDVVEVHAKCMTVDSAKGRYIVASDMVPIGDVFAALKDMYPGMPVADMGEMDYASGVPGKARKITSRVESELGLQLKPYTAALKDAIDSMIDAKLIASSA